MNAKMNAKRSSITVSIAQTSEEVAEALKFSNYVYERNYHTHWKSPPDLFFVARQEGEIVATGGLTFAAFHPRITAERYYCLTDGMRRFIATHRERIVEFGRFASLKTLSAKAILSSAVAYCALSEIDYIFSWATPLVSRYTCNQLGLNVWPIVVPLNLEGALQDPGWSSPPVGFFRQKQPPMLHLGVVPFWESAARALASECGVGAVPAWETPTATELAATASRAAAFRRSGPKLIRSEKDVAELSAIHRSPQQPDLAALRQAAAQLLQAPSKPA